MVSIFRIIVGGVVALGALVTGLLIPRPPAANIDMLMLIDNSPSMLIPATAEGIERLSRATSGCAFACHEIDKRESGLTEADIDSYQFARREGIELRRDAVLRATRSLVASVRDRAVANEARYRLSIAGFDYAYRPIWPANPAGKPPFESDLAIVADHVKDLKAPLYCRNNQRVCDSTDQDTSTDFTVALRGALVSLPDAAGGNQAPQKRAQPVLMIVTDGMRDEQVEGDRKLGPIPLALCDAIKRRGVRIAIVDTAYPLDAVKQD